jgi:Na+/H+ antiporter NhaD/arsenite permease-like protein
MTNFPGSLFASLDHVPAGVTILFGCLLIGLVLCLALEEKLHAKKSFIAGMFAIVCLLLATGFGILPYQPVVVGSHSLVEHSTVDGEYHDDEQAVDFHADATVGDEAGHHDSSVHVEGHEISMPVYIPAIDWGVIAIILGSSLFVDVTSKSGLFTWIAIKVTKRSGGDPLVLLWFYGAMTVVFSAVLNNVTAMIIVGSLTAVSLERLNRKQLLLGFLLIEGLLTNIGGLLTLISSVPNIIVGTAAGISFMTFFVKSAPYVVVSTIVTLWMGAKIFRIQRLSTDEQKQEAAQLVAGFDEKDGIESWNFFWFGAIMLCLFIITIATTSVLPIVSDLQMGFVALAFGCIMLIRFKSEVDNFYKAIDWDLLGFFMALFVVIYVMEHAGVLNVIGSGIESVLTDLKATPAHATDSSILLVGAALFSSVTDNIPLAAMLANILSSLGTPTDSGLWWSIIFGANLGGNITPIGSASTLVAVTIIHKHKLHLTFGTFVKMAAPYAAVQILMATIYVLLFLR